MNENNKSLPQWLVRDKTILLPKNNNTKLPKNYCPIACLKITYKIYASILNQFLVVNCTPNNIITTEQEEVKKHNWGCTDQLLINNMILEKVQHQRRNLFMMWFDYKKAFDSLPHDWILQALQLAKIPVKLSIKSKT